MLLLGKSMHVFYLSVHNCIYRLPRIVLSLLPPAISRGSCTQESTFLDEIFFVDLKHPFPEGCEIGLGSVGKAGGPILSLSVNGDRDAAVRF